ncbi:unnamed protein product [Ixodes hexagonus]
MTQAPVTRLPEPVGRTGCGGDEATADVDCARPAKGRMALLEKTLTEENNVRIALLREEHAVRIRNMEEDHEDLLHKRAQEFRMKEDEHRMKMETQQAKRDAALIELQRLQCMQKGRK